MSARDNNVSLLTPPGTGAIATISMRGPQAWETIRSKFFSQRAELPANPILHRVWFGNFGSITGDEVLIAVKQIEPNVSIEIHCHGGKRVARWILEQLEANEETAFSHGIIGHEPRALLPLSQASTLRTACILLDQLNGAFQITVATILENWPNSQADWQRLKSLAILGKHLVEPWKVVIAGPPNVGKSSLMNALAGFQRSVVAAIPGTTRDVVRIRTAFHGWPIELSDTAGLRDTTEAIENAGITMARESLVNADLVVWVMDGSDAKAEQPPDFLQEPLVVANKADLPSAVPCDGIAVSATTRAGIPGLMAAIVKRLVPHEPTAGEAVPFTPELAEAVERCDTLDQIQTLVYL